VQSERRDNEKASPSRLDPDPAVASDPYEILSQARLLAGEELRQFLDRACQSDPRLREDIEYLLRLERPTAAVPERLGRYRLLREIARGGMGVVYEALDERLERRVAVKILEADLARDGRAIERFHREARILAGLAERDHEKTIATIHDLESDGETHFFAMELLDAPTLADCIASGAMAWRRAFTLASRIARALSIAHERNIYHCDLKPANVLLMPGDRVKLIDFGIARFLEEAAFDADDVRVSTRRLLRASTLRGTPDYMSPEQLLGENVDHRTDIWALGCILFECLTGRPPAESTGKPSDALARTVPTAARRLVDECLAAAPTDRPQSTHGLSERIEAVLRDDARRTRVRRDVSRAAAGVAAIICVGFIAVKVRTPPVDTVESVNGREIRALDSKGAICWTRQLPANEWMLPDTGAVKLGGHYLVRDSERVTHVIAMTNTVDQGLNLRLLRGSDGDVIWTRPITWEVPVNAMGALRHFWTTHLFWGDPAERVIAVCVRDGEWYSTAILFVSFEGQLLAEYDNPGVMNGFERLPATPPSGESLLIFGNNSSARFRRDVVPFETRVHPGILALLKPPAPDGQAFPYSEDLPEPRDWPGRPRAIEAAYLVIPPAHPDFTANVESVSRWTSGDQHGFTAKTSDGRWIRVAEDLTPLSSYVDTTSPLQSTLSSTKTTRMLLIQEGQQRFVDVPIEF
jgi:tRNA A-37 threonylcarbamoyl transferase component Bud32